MNTVTADATSNTDELCPRLDATRPVDLTYYRRFLVCVDEKQPGRYVTFPLKSKPGPASSEDGNGKLGLPWFMRHTLKTRKEVHLSKQQRLQLDTKHAEAMEHLWKVFGKRPNDPYWAVGVEYEQRYECQGAHRGRLLGTVPLGLYPATKEITVRSWEKRVEHRVLTESLEEARTTDISGTERWTLAAKKQFVRDTNSTFNPSATLNSVTIPASSTPVTVGGALGMSGQMSSGTHNVVDQGSEFIQEATLKASQSIKTARTVTVETTTETGREETGHETLANPNRCNTLTYFYYEVVEDYRITVRPRTVDLFLFVPLPFAVDITPEWLVDQECLLRPLMPCEQIAKGFDAARQLLTLKRARELREARGGSGEGSGGDTGSNGNGADTDLQKVIAAGDAVIATYQQLSGAGQTQQGAGSWLYWELVKLLSPNLQRALDTLGERWEDSGFDKTSRTDVQAVLQQFEADLGDLNAEFMKVNAAVAFIDTGVAGTLILGFVVAVGALVAALELLGLDTLPDDRGLETKIERLLAKLHGVLEAPVVAAAPPPAGAAASTAAAPANAVANALALQLRQERELMEEVEAQVQSEALARHIFANNHHYHQIIWSRYDPNQIKLRLQELGIPTALFELRFYGFDLHYGAMRLVDLDAAVKLGFDRDAFSFWRKSLLEDARAKASNLSMPTGGTIVEPYLGQCLGADEFVARHRDLDLQRAEADLADARARVAQAEEEVKRMQARLAAGVLDDPQPFARADKVVVHAAGPAGPPAPNP